MAPNPVVPSQLKLRPFSAAEANALGISSSALRSRPWIRLSRGLYCWSGLVADPLSVLRTMRRLLPRDVVFAGSTAAWLFGIDVDPLHPIEVIVPRGSGMRSRRQVEVRRIDVPATHVVTVRGINATSPARTLADLCARLKGVEALAVLDSALRLKITSESELGQSSSMRVRTLGPLAEPAESPMETRLRWLLFQAGLPRPQVQTNLHDSQGRFVGRADLYYPQARLVIEFDGSSHRERLVEDNRRQNLLVNAGFALLRFTSADLRERPDTVVAQVRRALTAAAAAFARPRAAVRR